MNSRMRLLIEFLLVVAVFAAGIFAFYQYNVLNDTQENLTGLQSAATTLAQQAAAEATEAASNLESAQNSATQAAADANSTSTENSNIIASNYGTATRIALVNNANQQRNYATSTQAANDASSLLNNANAEATEAANEANTQVANLAATSTQAYENAASDLESANATSTQAANEASTELANINATSTQAADTANTENESLNSQIADLNQEIEDLDNELADTREDMATQRAELDTANDTIATREAEIASLQEGGGDNGNNNGGGGTNTDDLVLVETSRFEMMIFNDYIVINYEEDIDDALDEVRDLGQDYDVIADILEESAFYLELAGVRNDPSISEVMLVSYQRENREIPLQDFAETIVENIEDQDIEIEDESRLDLGGQEVYRIHATSGTSRNGFAQVYYILQDGRNYWTILFVTDIPNAEERLEDFDASVATFRVR